MKTALVTGGTGFLGLNLVEQLVERGWDVLAVHRATSDVRKLERLGVTLIECDLRDGAKLMREMPENLDAVFHVAADTSRWKEDSEVQMEGNLSGTKNLLDAALRRNAKCFHYTSSGAIFGVDDIAVTEDSPLLGKHCDNDYVKSKAYAEELVRDYMEKGLPTVIYYPGIIIGRHDANNWSSMLRLMHQGKLPFLSSGYGVISHAQEVARVQIVAAEKQIINRKYFVADGYFSFLQLAQAMARVLHREIPMKTNSKWYIFGALYALSVWGKIIGRRPRITLEIGKMIMGTPYFDSSKAYEELGYRATTLDAMCADCLDWLLEERLLDQEVSVFMPRATAAVSSEVVDERVPVGITA